MPVAANDEEQSDRKPYARGASIKERRPRQGGGGKPWSGDELVRLYSFVIKNGSEKIAWGEAVPGRTASQCSQTWKVTVSPFIVSALRARGKDGKKGE
ncbi:hypothetical protein P7C73_g6751, partial [Tremellales sp. Uapishka_1]